VATRFLRYWNETIQFQSTLSYLKSPPQGYQQPAVDVLKELASIQNRINSGFYSNQYAFEADFQLLTYALHDGHVALSMARKRQRFSSLVSDKNGPRHGVRLISGKRISLIRKSRAGSLQPLRLLTAKTLSLS
jgi:hypothetical protein